MSIGGPKMPGSGTPGPYGPAGPYNPTGPTGVNMPPGGYQGQNAGPGGTPGSSTGVTTQGSGFFSPGMYQIDPTPPALRPLQAAITQMFAQKLAGGAGGYGGGGVRAAIPGANIHNQLYGGGSMPTYGQVVSGSRMIRSNNPTYNNVPRNNTNYTR